MEDQLSTKSVKLPVFDGKHESYQKWWFRYREYASVMGFIDALGDQGEADLPTKETTVLDATVDTRKILAKKRNQLAFASLAVALETDKLIEMSMKAMTADWLSGLA